MILTLLTAAFLSQTAPLERPAPLLFAADGPGQSKTAVALGGRLFLFTGGDLLPVPTLAFDLARGLSEDTDLVLHISTVGVLSMAEGGARVRLGRAGGARFLALAELAGVLGLGTDADNRAKVAAAGGLIPGLGMSIGEAGEPNWTFGFDLPLIVGRNGVRTTTFDRTVLFRPSVTVEGPGGLYGRVEVYVPSNFSNIAPTAAIGYAW